MKPDLDNLTPREIVRELDKFIVGQDKAKKAVAIALRNRTRRQKLPEEMREEIVPKNIIMIGPTGVGKTEIARRLSRLCGAPFVKVEATKFTEVGYVGRDVESMVRDLMSFSVSMVREEMRKEVEVEAEKRAEEALLDILLPRDKPKPRQRKKPGNNAIPMPFIPGFTPAQQISAVEPEPPAEEPETSGSFSGEKQQGDETREKFRDMLHRGVLDERQVEVTVSSNSSPAIEIFSGTGMEDMEFRMGGIQNMFGPRKKKRRVTVKEALGILLDEETNKLVDQDKVAELARVRAENMGIIFVDEIDKIASRGSSGGTDVSREGVQRDILPLVEGSKVNTRYGMVDTSHILFIAAGAFHMSKPSDLIPELQGRFPIRVELQDLGSEDFKRILTQPKNALTIQYKELLKTEDISLEFLPEAIHRISEIAGEVNSKTENIGARRLHTILELLLEDISFEGPERKGEHIVVTKELVDARLKSVMEDQDLSRYIL